MKRRNIFKSNNDDMLPSLSTSSPRLNGSGSSIHMDAPIVREWKNSSSYTKGSYFWLFGSLATVYLSYRYMMYHYATTYLSCDGSFCTLKIIPPNRDPRLVLKIHRDQIITSKHIKVSSSGDFMQIPGEEGASSSTIDKDEEAKFDSYGIILNQYGKEIVDLTTKEEELRREMADHGRKMVMGEGAGSSDINKVEQELMDQYGSAIHTDPELRQKFEKQRQELIEEGNKQREQRQRASEDLQKAKEYEYNMQLKQIFESKRRIQRDRKDLPDLSELNQWAEWDGDQQYMLILRKYNIGHRKRRVQSLMRTIMNYVQGKRDRVTIRENRDVTWQGIVGLVFGMFSFLLCVLIGQFYEPVKRRTMRSPNNARRQINHFNNQNPTVVPRTFANSSTNRRPSAPTRQKAYGGYVPGKSTY